MCVRVFVCVCVPSCVYMCCVKFNLIPSNAERARGALLLPEI